MSLANILYTLVIGPLEAFFETIYLGSYKLLGSPGLSIIGMSLIMNLLLMPLYKQTDAIQLDAIETEKRLKPYVSHIKKTFKGNEQFMMLQTCYRQNHYKPTDALRGIAPLALEIPFFMAAYNFLSGLKLLSGASLGPIGNLGMPDGLLVLGGVSINVLPILMTLINIASSAIYTKGAPIKTKVQLYGMAALFLILLYGSPSGLVFYWTLNNLFSLVKNLLMKVRRPARREKKKRAPVVITARDKRSFFVVCLVLTLLSGVMIPAALIHTSPEEFLIQGLNRSPNLYVLSTALINAGFYLIWMTLFYFLAKPRGKKLMELTLWVLCAASIVNYMAFGKNYGTMSSQLIFDAPIFNGPRIILKNLIVLAVAAALVWLIWRRKADLLRMAGVAAIIAMTVMSALNLHESEQIITDKLRQIDPAPAQVEPLFRLSKTGKNVVVLMTDRGMGKFVPYIFNEKPELKEQFDGFTFYSHTMSYGSHTNFGLPSVFGGYEYTPMELNRRDDLTLVEKHNEALKLMPTLFRGQDYEITVCDPTYAGYDWIPDLTVFDDPEIDTHITMGRYNPDQQLTPEEKAVAMQRKFLYYGIFKTAPVALHQYIYDGGRYQAIAREEKSGQSFDSLIRATGETESFTNCYNVLHQLSSLTEITDEPTNTFMMMCNDTPHSPQLLQMPNYEPQAVVDNSAFESAQPQRTGWDGDTLTMTTSNQIRHYHCNMATYLQIGRWLDYLRENDVYDNTRIIIVGDHGYYLELDEASKFGTDYRDDTAGYNPVLMVKDFGSTGFQVDDAFMTNADVPSIAMKGLIENPVNPFTGHPVNQEPKLAQDQYVFISHKWNIAENRGNTYQPDRWARVHGDFLDAGNWTYIGEGILPENVQPAG